jgi:hypothetical protein
MECTSRSISWCNQRTFILRGLVYQSWMRYVRSATCVSDGQRNSLPAVYAKRDKAAGETVASRPINRIFPISMPTLRAQ